jgi:hypothetical protein
LLHSRFENNEAKGTPTPWDRCYVFKNIFDEITAGKMEVFTQNSASLWENKNENNISFLEKRIFFAEKWRKSLKIVTITLAPFAACKHRRWFKDKTSFINQQFLFEDELKKVFLRKHYGFTNVNKTLDFRR